MSDTPRLFDVPGIVRYLRTAGATAASASFVRGLINSGQLRHIKVGKAFYVSKLEIDGWLARAEKKRGARS